MSIDRNKISEALTKFSKTLPEAPKWIVLMTRNGELLGRSGEYTSPLLPPLNDQTIASFTQNHATNEIEMLDGTRHGTFQFTVSIGSDGVYFIFHLVDRYLLAISYYSVGVRSIDAVLDTVYNKWRDLFEEIFEEL